MRRIDLICNTIDKKNSIVGMESPFLVGCRVKDAEGYKATVRYIGPVAAAKNQEETWLGVEWDNQTRGKHDGSCVDSKGDLHRYFDCADGAVGGPELILNPP